MSYTVYILGQCSNLLAPVFCFAIWFKLVYGQFGQSNMHHRLDFCPRLARKDSNNHQPRTTRILVILALTLPKISLDFRTYCPNLYTVMSQHHSRSGKAVLLSVSKPRLRKNSSELQQNRCGWCRAREAEAAMVWRLLKLAWQCSTVHYWRSCELTG